MRYLGIDYGTKKIGLALSNESGSMAFPHSVVAQSPHLVRDLVSLIALEHVDALVVGKSRSLSGEDNALERDIEVFLTELGARVTLPVYRESEVYTSQEALHIQGRNQLTDASAAALILNSFFTRTNISNTIKEHHD